MAYLFVYGIQISLVSLCVFGQRERVKFDFDWLFTIIPPPNYNCPTSDFPIDLNGIQCLGLTQVNANTAQECLNACCGDINCQTWQWCANSTCNPVSSCWIGSMAVCENSGSGWISGGRHTPAPIPPYNNSYSKPDFPDNNWRKVDIPHDYIVESGAFSPENERTHGYLPKNFSWYRKHFQLPNDWQNSSIWIDFDGVYRNSDVYLNGIYLGNHQSGYTSFRWYIDHVPLNFDGKDNVLAVRVDPSHDEGCTYIYIYIYLFISEYPCTFIII